MSVSMNVTNVRNMMRNLGKWNENGSALLIGLMLIAGLSMLGLGFVAISETENAISINHRNAAQVQSVAEGGTRAVVEWFQNPERMTLNGLMPQLNDADKAAMKRDRWLLDGKWNVSVGTLTNVGKFESQSIASAFCCDRPFRPAPQDRLFGTEDTPDVVIDRTTSTTSATVNGLTGTFLQRFNQLILPVTMTDVRITRIEIYGPPMLNGTRNANNFWQTGDRYGLGTVRATAQKFRSVSDADAAINPSGTAPNPIARRVVRAVISEWPFPGPQGPIQSNANITTGGSVQVHWGKITAQLSLFVKRDLSGLPWFNAHDRIAYGYGYDSSKAWQAGKTYIAGDVVHPSDAAMAERRAYRILTPGLSGTVEPVWPETGNISETGPGTATWVTTSKTRYPVQNVDIRDSEYWLLTIAGKVVDDPWIEARSRGAIINGGIPTSPHPFKYTGAAQDEFGLPNAGLSNWFQNQTTTDTAFPKNRKEVAFPRIDYQFWKDLATNGRGTEGVYFLKWVAGENYTDGRQTKNFAQWTDIEGGNAKPGFYFFDTRNGQNPQVTGGSAFLTPAVDVNSSDSSNTWTMQGFIYLNSVEFGTQGVNGVGGNYNFPGEPYLDEGYWAVDLATGRLQVAAATTYPTAVQHVKVGQENREWDSQDVNLNGVFDLKLRQVDIISVGPGANVPLETARVGVWVPVPFFDGCTTFGQAGQCSEPHEPYLNLQYPATACCAGASAPNPLTLGWQDPVSQTRRPKKRRSDDTIPANPCAAPADYLLCTSNLYDRDGFLDRWTATGEAPVLDGVFYNEGDFSPAGNARYFGSLLIKGDVDAGGTPEVWFDERLIKDEWPPKEWPFPRVFITALQTEN